MPGSGDIPVFAAEPRPGAAAACWIGRFGVDHGRVTLGAHAHRDLELLWFERGGGRHRIGDRAWQVAAGDAYLVAPHAVHDLSAIGQRARGWVVQFAAEPPATAATGAPSGWRGLPLLAPFFAAELDAGCARIAVPGTDRERWRARFEAMEAEHAADTPDGQVALRAWLTLLLVDVARLLPGRACEAAPGGDDMLANALRVIDERFAEGVTPAQVATALGFTTGHVSTAVRRRTGRGLQAWILERQMSEARRLLVDTALPVQAIAARCGFGDAAYFGRRFRQHHGTSPSEWRAGRTGD